MTVLPTLDTGDVYVYAHANGAVFVAYGDGRSLLAPLPEAIAIARGCVAAGCRVVVAGDDAPLAIAALDRLHDAGVVTEAFGAAAAPHTWSDGTDALMEAAALGSDAVLDDLIERGADVDRVDDSGATALHHAAGHGNRHAIDALVAAGADLDRRNDQGFTPLLLARACREHAAVVRLEVLGADPSATPSAERSVRFGRSHLGTYAVWLVPFATVVAVAIGFWPLPLIGAAALAAFAVAVAVVAPPGPSWRGGAPRRLDGTVLTIRPPFGRERAVDLTGVTAAALGAATTRSARLGAGWLLLDHPLGVPCSRRTFERLLVPPADLDAVAARFDRVLVVPIAGGRRAEVLVPVGNLLSSRGVDLSASLRTQLAMARTGGSTPPG